MRIGIDASRAFVDQPTGTERYAFEVIKEILKLPEAREHEWILYTRKLSVVSCKLLVKLGVKEFSESTGKMPNVTVQPISLPYLWTQVGLAARTWTDRLDVLWVPAHTLPLFRRGFAGFGKPLKTVVTIHGIEYEWLPAYENLLQRWYLPLSTKYAVAMADRIISVSEFTKQQLIIRLGGNEKKITVVHEGITVQGNEMIDGGRREQVKVMKKFGLKRNGYLLFVGTVQPRKNLVRLIEAFSKLTDRSLKLVIAGGLGWQFEAVIRAVKEFGVESKVDILGYISDIDRYILLENCLAYVQPSITEGFGLPVLEAMAAGIPVATSSGGALGEIVGVASASNAAHANVACAVVFDPLDVETITDALNKMVTADARFRRELGEKGRIKSQEFSWEKAAGETLRILTTTR